MRVAPHLPRIAFEDHAVRSVILALSLLVTACTGPTETLTVSGQVQLPQAAAYAFKVEGSPVLISNFDGNLGKIKATTLDAAGKFTMRIERTSLPEAPQWFKVVFVHPSKNGPMLSRAVILSRGGQDAEGLMLNAYSSLTQMAIEYQYQLDPSRTPTTLSPAGLEEDFAGKGDSFLIDAAFHQAYAKYASGSTEVSPAADSELAAEARGVLFP